MSRSAFLILVMIGATLSGEGAPASSGAQDGLPAGPLTFGVFTATFPADRTFTIAGEGWPALTGTWTVANREVTMTMPAGPKDCSGPGRYAFTVEGSRVHFALAADECTPRRMILDGSTWVPSWDGPSAGRAPDRRARPRRRGTGCRAKRRRSAAGRRFADRWRRASPRVSICPIGGILERRGNPVAHHHSRPRAFQSRDLGRSRLRDDRDQQPRATRPSSPASTATATRPTIDRVTAGWSTRSIAGPAAFAGSRSRPKASRGTSATSSRPTPARRRPPTAGSSWRGSDRRASSPTT